MLRYGLRGFAARRLRAAGTILAVFLGVAFVAGTYILTDTINRSFDDIFTTALQGTDVVVTPKEIVQQDATEPPAFDASLVDKVRGVDGVERAEGGIGSLVRLVDKRGDPLGSEFAPNFVFSTLDDPFKTTTVTDGRSPERDGEAALDASTAEKNDLGVGETVRVAGEGPARSFEIVGLTRLGDTSGGASGFVVTTLADARALTDKAGKLDQISIATADGVPPGEVKQRVAEALPDSVRVETGQESASRQTSEIGDDLAFLTIALLIFSGVAVVVGAFLIFNTFSITVAQRIREFGLLRTLGASRRQLLLAVGAEAFGIAVVGTLLGLAGGIVFAKAINALLEGFGIDLPNTGLVFATRTVLVSLLVGILVTLVASLVPALRATRVTPMAALLEAELPASRRKGRVTAAVATLLGIGGLGLLCIGLFAGLESSGQAAGLMGAGAAAMLFAVSLYSPRLVRPLASLAGRPLESMRGLTGRLARENAVRKPGRTAVTAAALMIGLALVTFVTVFASGLNGSVAAAIDRTLQGDVIVQNRDGFSPIPAQLSEDIAEVDGVDAVSTVASINGEVSGQAGASRISGVEPDTVGSVLELDWEDGSDRTIAGLRDGQAVIDKAWGESNGVGVGDRIRVLTPTDERASYEVVGSVADGADFLGDFILTRSALARDFGERRGGLTLLTVPDGAPAGPVKDRVERLVKAQFPSAQVLDQTELKQQQEEQIMQLLGLVYALLALAVIVSIFGIVNTLALSIHERTRELGMLRAIGMSRRQVRRVIRYEAVITAMIGAILGSLLGVLFAALISRPLADEGFELSFPIGTLIALLVFAALAGVLAAIGPARRAARLNVLDALAYE